MWLAPKVIHSNQVDNRILAIITKPSKMLERTLFWEIVKMMNHRYDEECSKKNNCRVMRRIHGLYLSWSITEECVMD